MASKTPLEHDFFQKVTTFEPQLGGQNHKKTVALLRALDIFALLGVWCRLLALLGPIWDPPPYGPRLQSSQIAGYLAILGSWDTP